MRAMLFVLAPFAVLTSAAAAFAAEIRVPQDAATVQAAVDQAQAGDEIVVRRKKYKERVTIAGRTDLTLRGGGATLDAQSDGVCLRIENSTGIVVSGFAFNNGGGGGVVVATSSDVEVSDCKVAGTFTGSGIDVKRCTDVRVLRNRISKISSDGIEIGGFYGDPVGSDDCVVEGNSIKKAEGSGIVVRGSRNTVHDNTITASDSWSISLWDTDGAGDDNLVTGNVVRKSGFGGVRIAGNRATCTENKVLKCDFNGFSIEEGTGHALTANFAKSAQNDGYHIEPEASGCVLRNNVVVKATDDGFNIRGDGNLLEDNESVKAGNWGFLVRGTGNTLRRNVSITSKEEDCVDLTTPGANTYEDNTFREISVP